MSQSTAMTLLAITAGVAVFCLLLDRMSRLFSDARVRNLSDYLLIFRQGLRVLNERRWIVLIPLGIAFLGWLFQFVSQVKMMTDLSKQGYGAAFEWSFFPGSLRNLYSVGIGLRDSLLPTAMNAFAVVGTFDIQVPGLFYQA